MIRFRSALFTEAADGDLRADPAARRMAAERADITAAWAELTQVHGVEVRRVAGPGHHGDGDALLTTEPGLPLAVFTADCAGVVVNAEHAVGVAHAGWRGAADGVVAALVNAMEAEGHVPLAAFVGPLIGPCCFEVGPEVAERFPGRTATTTWGTRSVDLRGVIADQLGPVSVEFVPGCTRHESRWFSHRRDGTGARMAAVGWVEA